MDAQTPTTAISHARVNALVGDVPTAETLVLAPDAVLLAATAAHQRQRYAVGKTARQISFVRRLMSTAMFDRILRRQFHMPA